MLKKQKNADAVLTRAAESRRKFTKKLVRAAFAVPTMMSFAMDDVAFGASGAGQQFPTFLSTVQQANSSPAMRFYCIPEDPALRVFTPRVPTSGV